MRYFAGLSWFSIEASADALSAGLKAANAPHERANGTIETADPWGTRVRIVKA